MEWYRQVQFIAAVPMAEDAAEEFGTTVNGMWAGPEARSDESVAHAYASGQRVLFSVPLIAVVPAVYQAGPTSHLLDEVCRDTQGNQALVPWYYWEPEPVYAACIYSPVFRRYLLRRCRQGIDTDRPLVPLLRGTLALHPEQPQLGDLHPPPPSLRPFPAVRPLPRSGGPGFIPYPSPARPQDSRPEGGSQGAAIWNHCRAGSRRSPPPETCCRRKATAASVP